MKIRVMSCLSQALRASWHLLPGLVTFIQKSGNDENRIKWNRDLAGSRAVSGLRSKRSGGHDDNNGRDVRERVLLVHGSRVRKARRRQGSRLRIPGGHVDNPSYEQVCSGTTGHAESVQITYNPAEVSYDQLLEVFWKTHDPTTRNRQGNDIGPQYRSVIFITTRNKGSWRSHTRTSSRRKVSGIARSSVRSSRSLGSGRRKTTIRATTITIPPNPTAPWSSLRRLKSSSRFSKTG